MPSDSHERRQSGTAVSSAAHSLLGKARLCRLGGGVWVVWTPVLSFSLRTLPECAFLPLPYPPHLKFNKYGCTFLIMK